MNNQDMLHEFNRKFGFQTQLRPCAAEVAPAQVALRLRLMMEELGELACAMNDAMNTGDLVDVADGLADLMYVVYGTAATYGIPLDAVFAEVHRSNMTKLNLASQLRPGEKGAFKGLSFQPPEIAEILEAHS